MPQPDEPIIAASQWNWLKRTLLPSGGSHPVSVLDLGCGHGAFLLAARQDGMTVAGLELNPAAVKSCRGQNLPVAHGSIFDIGLPHGPWDVITMWDVLEHLEDPRRALQMVVHELAPRGLIVLRGRNARLHGRFQVFYARIRPLAMRLGVPDLSCIHRWGFGPGGYQSLLRHRGLGEVQLHPGVPTPGDRFAAMGSAVLASTIKGSVSAFSRGVYQASFHRLYPFPSVLISGRKLAAVSEAR
jgi:SAM-dependent methyltransferase